MRGCRTHSSKVVPIVNPGAPSTRTAPRRSFVCRCGATSASLRFDPVLHVPSPISCWEVRGNKAQGPAGRAGFGGAREAPGVTKRTANQWN